ncbi:MAG TPA: LemA family protein [Acidobacteriaceae bacterium]|nr:LemA family protein [Acidobacteriaceae bacterium]
MKAGWVALGVVGLLVIAVLIGAGTYISSRNTMVQMNEDVNQTFHQIDVEQQRRLDLIPNLVASVKGYVNEEQTVLTNIANARAGIVAAGSGGDHAGAIQAYKAMDVAISPLLRLQESYPNLRSNEQFVRLTDELAGTENRIKVARERYNKSLEAYNVYVRQFPNSVWANMAGFHYRDEYYTGDVANKVAPKVDFGK